MSRTRAETWSGETWDDPDDEKLYDLLSEMNLTHRFVIVERLDAPDPSQHYMQVYLNDDMSCLVQYREGGPQAHFEARVPAPFAFSGHETVAAVLQDYARGGDRWRTALPWAPWSPPTG